MRPLFDYLSAARAEVAKVSWPTRNQAFRLTLMVIIFTIIFATLLGILDYLFSIGLQRLIS